MPDLADLLDRTTPRNLRPVDVAAIGRIARHRRRRQRVLTVAALALVVVALAGAVVGLGGDGQREADVASVAPGPGGALLEEPVGAWRAGAEPPFSARGASFAATLSDGRVLVWGGTTPDGGIYDPETDTWEAIEPAPLLAGSTTRWQRLADDRLLVLGVSVEPPGVLHGAVYDVATATWHELPTQTDVLVHAEGVAWDGEHLALVRLDRGGQGWHDSDLDWRVVAPTTLRWTFGDEAWTLGTRPPLGFRFGAAVAFDGERLAVVGGTQRDVWAADEPGASEPDPRRVADGAIYDLTTDTWELLPALPSDGTIHASATWNGGRLYVGGGNDRLADPGPDRSALFVLDAATDDWTALESSPSPGIGVLPSGLLATSVREASTSGPQVRAFYGPEGWEVAPLGDVHRIGDLIVATSVPLGNPGDDPFAVEVRVGRDQWLSAAEAPFTNRMEPAVAVTGDLLVVVGGYEGRNLEPRADTWVYDLAG